MTTKTKVQLGLIVVLAVFVLSLILSQVAAPDFPPLFAFKRVQEKSYLKLKSNPQDRLDYMSSLLDKRLNELSNVVKNKSYGYVLKSALRYSTLAGQITDQMITNNFKDKVPAITDQFRAHQKVLQNLYEIYPKNIPDNAEWKYILDDYNYLKIYLDQLSNFFKVEKA